MGETFLDLADEEAPADDEIVVARGVPPNRAIVKPRREIPPQKPTTAVS